MPMAVMEFMSVVLKLSVAVTIYFMQRLEQDDAT